MILFSTHPIMGLEMKNMKYISAAAWLIVVNGGSTGFVAVHVITRNVAVNVQNRSCMSGRNVIDRSLDVWVNGVVRRIIMDIVKASAPPSLLGTDRRTP